MLADGLLGFLSGVAVRTAELRSVSGFAEDLPVGENNDLMLRLAARGKFALLRHRTTVIQHTRGSRTDRGIVDGAYLTAFEDASRRAIEAVSTAERSDRGAMEAMARGRLRYAAVLRGLADQDDGAVDANLTPACRLLPELSRQPVAVTRRIRRAINEPAPCARALAVTAELWPDQTADTALFLRLSAVSAALGRGRPTQALGLLRGLPAGPTLRFVVANVPLWRRLARGAVRRRVYRGQDQPVGAQGAATR
jgi:hypothetical protein